MRFAWAIMALGLVVTAAAPALGQDQNRDPPSVVALKQNWPNPFNPSTTIPFSISRESFQDGRRPLVSLRIYNILTQLVAIPILQGEGRPLDNVQLEWNGTGSYSAYWDGRVLNSNREAPSGIYIYQLMVDGKRFTRRMIVAK